MANLDYYRDRCTLIKVDLEAAKKLVADLEAIRQKVRDEMREDEF